jgi:hypothetical protein
MSLDLTAAPSLRSADTIVLSAIRDDVITPLASIDCWYDGCAVPVTAILATNRIVAAAVAIAAMTLLPLKLTLFFTIM